MARIGRILKNISEKPTVIWTNLVVIRMLTTLLIRDLKELSNIKKNLNCFRDYLNHYKQIISNIMDLAGGAGVVSEREIY